jgi:hypothetical protein
LNYSTKIIIERQKKIKAEYGETFCADDKVYEVKDKQHLKRFRDLFKNAERTGYCCCPETNYTISFYRFQTKLYTYEVDTIAFREKVQIFDYGYQYSFLVDKQLWNNYLNEISTK